LPRPYPWMNSLFQYGATVSWLMREGVILDAQVFGVNRVMTTVERRVIRESLAGLAGEDLGDDVAAWEKFWRDNKRRLLADAGNSGGAEAR
ncbi:MAG: hypothetical protein ABFS86_20830, partial [Planctomycetota bacterium]